MSISIAAVQVVVSQITGSYSCTYKKAWMAKQKATMDLFRDWRPPIACCLRIWRHSVEKTIRLLCGVLNMGPRLTRTNSSECSSPSAHAWMVRIYTGSIEEQCWSPQLGSMVTISCFPWRSPSLKARTTIVGATPWLVYGRG